MEITPKIQYYVLHILVMPFNNNKEERGNSTPYLYLDRY